MDRHFWRAFLRGLSGALAMLLVPAIWAQGQMNAGPSNPKAVSAESENARVVVVELFTSEGCSSCPPADAILRKINGTHTQSGALIVGISEHVTYWNSLGWSDPFSSSLYTERQNAYAETFHLASVFTPQMVIDGAEQIVGSDEDGLARAIRKEEKVASPVSVHIVSTTVEGKFLRVTFSAIGNASTHDAAILAVVADDTDQSNVLRGENSGRTLAHAAVARSIQKIAKLESAPEQTVQVSLPASFQEGQKHHLILFAQSRGNGRILGAESKAL